MPIDYDKLAAEFGGTVAPPEIGMMTSRGTTARPLSSTRAPAPPPASDEIDPPPVTAEDGRASRASHLSNAYRGFGRGVVKSAGRMAYNLGRAAYASPFGHVVDAIHGEDAARAAFGVGDTAPEYGAFDEDLQYADTAEQVGGVGLDLATAFLPVTKVGLAAKLAAKVPQTGRAGRLAARAGAAVREGGFGAVLGQAQQNDAGTGGVTGAVLGGALGRSAEAVEAAAKSQVTKAKQRVGQAIATTTKPNKRFVERHAEQIARQSRWGDSLDTLQQTAIAKAEQAGKQIDQVLAGVRQGDRTSQLRGARKALQQAASALLTKAGGQTVELAPATREALELAAQTLANANPRSTSLEALADARAAIDRAIAEVGMETTRRGRQIAAAGAVRSAFDSAISGGAVSRSRSAARGARGQVDQLTADVAPSRIRTAPIVGRLRAMQRTYTGVNDAGAAIIHNEQAVKQLDDLIAQVQAYGPEMNVDQVRRVRQLWDDIVAGADGKGFLTNLADESRRGAVKRGANVLRSKIGAQVPALQGPNAAYSFNRNLADAVGDTLTRRTGQTKGPIAGLATGIAAGLGGIGGIIAAGPAGVLAAAPAALLYGAIRMVKSPEFNLFSAKARLALADALRAGSVERIRQAMTRLATEAQTQRVGGLTAAGAAAGVAPDITDPELQLMLERLQQGEELPEGLTDPATDPDDLLYGEPELPADDPAYDDALYGDDPGAVEELAPEASGVPRGTLDVQQAGMVPPGLLEAAGGLLGPLTRPMVDLPELPDSPRLNRALQAVEAFTSPLDVAATALPAVRALAPARAARPLAAAQALTGGAMAAQGGLQTREALQAGDPIGAVGGALQAGAGGLIARSGGRAARELRMASAGAPMRDRLPLPVRDVALDVALGPASAIAAGEIADTDMARGLVEDDQLRQLLALGLTSGVAHKAVRHESDLVPRARLTADDLDPDALDAPPAPAKRPKGPKFDPKRIRLGRGAATYKEIARRLDEDGGFTIDMKTGKPVTSGSMVALYPNDDPRVLVIDRAKFTPRVLGRYVDQMRKQLAGDERHLGGWISDGKVYLDVPRRVVADTLPDQVRKATKIGEGKKRVRLSPDAALRESSRQKAIFTLDNFTEAPVANWRSFAEGAEVKDRLRALQQIGEEYLATKQGAVSRSKG